jgi:hypothetical protein
MAKRTISTIKQFDYTSKVEFLNDVNKMKLKGYILVDNGMYNDVLKHGAVDDEVWKYTASFIKSKFI